MPSPSAASVAQNKTKTPPPQPNIITLYGHISGEKDNLIKLKIDWLEQVIDLKYAIKEANERVLNYLAANQLVVYKLDIENKDDNGYSGLENGWTLNQYPTEAWSRLKLKNTDYLHKLWSDGPTNEMDRIHFLVVLPDQKPSSMASHSPSTASVVQNETTPRPPPKIITLFGHISGEKENLIKLKIDWLEQVIDLKYAIKEANEPDLNYLAAEELVVYKLDIENTDDNGYVGLENGWTLDQYPTETWSHFKLKDTDYLHKLWSDEKGMPTNEMDRIHFLVVTPEQNEPPAKRQKISDDMDSLIITLRQWTEEQARRKPPAVEEETLRAFGNSFPLQQCEDIFTSLRDRMLANFQIKLVGDYLDWKKNIKIPIVGAASGTGKTAICSRMLQYLAHQAQMHDSPPSSARDESDSPTQACYDPSSTVISDPKATPGNYLSANLNVDTLFWSEQRLKTFRAQLIRSNERRLTLTIDFATETFSQVNDAELNLAVSILTRYQEIHHRGDPMWKTEDELISLLKHQLLPPLDFALGILRGVENNNIIVIHLDETQAVDLDILREVVRRLVSVMGPDQGGEYPFIFPILSGLSLETLLNCSVPSGAGIIRYTPPILTVDSMLTIIDAMLSSSGDGATKPSKPLGLRRFLHDIRGPTRYFQAALYILQQLSTYGHRVSDSFCYSSIVDRNAIRAGIEEADQNWPAVFDAVSRMTQTPVFIRNLNILRKNNQLMVELFELDVRGEEISVYESFMVDGKEQPLSYLIQRGWLTICDFVDGCSKQVRCGIFLPFLTVFNTYCGSQNPLNLADHPGMVPLCKKFHWTQNEQYDAKTLQYKLLMSWVEDNSSPPTCKLSTIFGDLGAVADVSFVICAEVKYKELSDKVEKSKHLNDLMHRSDTCLTVYLNADKAEFADSFVFLSLEQPSKHQYHILCIQSKLFKASALSIGQVEKEYEKVRLVCASHPFTLVIAADRLTNKCLTQLANHTNNDLKSHVLVLDQEGFDIFYGKPFAYRRRFMTGPQSLPVFCEDEDNSNSP